MPVESTKIADSTPTVDRCPIARREPIHLFDYGRLRINDTDVESLDPDEFLNDTIIDFYLNYLWDALPLEERERVHVFSTFFWNGLTSPAQKNLADGGTKTKWAKNVDLFEKDFILIPINQNSHWYLAIVCYPRFGGRDKDDGTETPDDEDDASPLAKKSRKDRAVPKNRPCIVLLDSLRGSRPNYKTTAEIRKYLASEWAIKNESTADQFSKKSVKSFYPIPPQQGNYSDCGLFLLEYAERFFFNGLLTEGDDDADSTKITIVGQDFWSRIATAGNTNLDDWFPANRVEKKRVQLKTLVNKLVEKWKSRKSHDIKKSGGENGTVEKFDDVVMIFEKSPIRGR